MIQFLIKLINGKKKTEALASEEKKIPSVSEELKGSSAIEEKEKSVSVSSKQRAVAEGIRSRFEKKDSSIKKTEVDDDFGNIEYENAF